MSARDQQNENDRPEAIRDLSDAMPPDIDATERQKAVRKLRLRFGQNQS